MSGTRSLSRTAPATDPWAAPVVPQASPSALIVAHGSPSAPAGPEAAMRSLAGRVAGHLPGWRVRGTTLAGEGTLAAALQGDPDGRPLIYPFFMADGWFVRTKLPQRIRDVRGDGFDVLPPLGLDPALPALCLEYLQEASWRAGPMPAKTTVLLAAHGSRADPRPRRAVERVARAVKAAGVFRGVHLGFIEEPPFLAEAARIDGPALCLPFFAGRAGHVEVDLPEALADASFPGQLLDPIGLWPQTARIVAAALLRSR